MEKYLLMPQTEMGSLLYSGTSTDMADTVSLLRRQRVHEHPRAWHRDLPITSMPPEKSPDPLRPEPTHGALDRTAELLAKLLSGSEDPDVTALSEAVKAKLGITEPLPKPALLSPSPGLSTLVKVLPWVVDGAGGLGAGKTSGAGTRGVDLNAAIGGRTGYSDTNGGKSSNN